MPSHYLNQCWNIVNCTDRNKFQWNFNRNSNIFIIENALENVVCEMASIFLSLNVLTQLENFIAPDGLGSSVSSGSMLCFFHTSCFAFFMIFDTFHCLSNCIQYGMQDYIKCYDTLKVTDWHKNICPTKITTRWNGSLYSSFHLRYDPWPCNLQFKVVENIYFCNPLTALAWVVT